LKQRPEPQVAQNLYYLLAEFVDYLHKEERVAYAKADLMRASLLNYLIARDSGELAPRANRAAQKKQKPAPVASTGHPLLPDRRTFMRFLSLQEDEMEQYLYEVTALVELMPAWLRFLTARGLLESGEQQAATSELLAIKEEIANRWAEGLEDPVPVRALAEVSF
jgi:hypothetical protein